MNASVWFIAGLLTGVAATAIALPLLRRAAHGAARRTLRIAVAAGGVVACATVVAIAYLTLGAPQQPAAMATAAPPDSSPAAMATAAPPDSSPSASSTGKVPSMEEATARLEARLARGGGSPADWQLLAQSYEFLGRTEDAQRARARATGTVSSQPTAITDATVAAGQAIMAGSVVAATPANAAAEISGTVSIDDRLASSVGRDAILFIYAKAADSPGPPLAVVRVTANTWPVRFRLDDSMAMLPARRLSQFPRVVIEARVSRTGQASPGPGDLYVTSDVLTPGAGRKVALVINRQIG